jgi:dienelactone hydrolase
LLVLHAPDARGSSLAHLAALEPGLARHELSPAALASDRRALPELERALDALRARPGVDPERVGVLGLGRGGTLAFLLGCARRVAAVVDVEGPLSYPMLSAERPIQPLELALNLEGAFLGVFAATGSVDAQQRALLRIRLASAARPFELVELPGEGGSFFDPRARGYDARRAEGLCERVLAFLAAHLAPEPP